MTALQDNPRPLCYYCHEPIEDEDPCTWYVKATQSVEFFHAACLGQYVG